LYENIAVWRELAGNLARFGAYDAIQFFVPLSKKSGTNSKIFF
jgi:hypothetical protein